MFLLISDTATIVGAFDRYAAAQADRRNFPGSYISATGPGESIAEYAERAGVRRAAGLGLPGSIQINDPDAEVDADVHPLDTAVVLARADAVMAVLDAADLTRELAWAMLDAGYAPQAIAIRKRGDEISRLLGEIQSLATRCGRCGVYGDRCEDIFPGF